jgi:hypothetical protein
MPMTDNTDENMSRTQVIVRAFQILALICFILSLLFDGIAVHLQNHRVCKYHLVLFETVEDVYICTILFGGMLALLTFLIGTRAKLKMSNTIGYTSFPIYSFLGIEINYSIFVVYIPVISMMIFIIVNPLLALINMLFISYDC